MCEDVQIVHSLSLKGFPALKILPDALCLSLLLVFSFTFCLSISVWLNQRLAVALPTLSISVLMNLETKAVRCQGLEASASVSSFCTKVKPWYSRHAQREIHLSLFVGLIYFIFFGMPTIGCKRREIITVLQSIYTLQYACILGDIRTV